MRAVIFSFLTLLLFTAGCVGQSDWAAVRELKSGTRVMIVENSGAETKGRVLRSDDISIVLDKGRTLGRDSIARVYLTKRGSMLKRALIGAAAGAGIGAAVGAVVVVATKTDGLAAAGGFLYGIPIGAAVGAATTGRKRGRLIYQSP